MGSERVLHDRLRDLEEFTRGMYARTHDRWEAARDRLVTGECGFALLSGPPRIDAELLILGTNYGYSRMDVGAAPSQSTHWPQESWLPSADWALARRLRSLFERAELIGLHDQATMTNFLFFKSSSIDKNGDPLAWVNNDADIRRDLEKFCRQELGEFILRSGPKRILVIGTGALKANAEVGTFEELLRDRKNKRALISTGVVFGVSAIGLIHLTGNRIAVSDFDKMALWLSANISSCKLLELPIA